MVWDCKMRRLSNSWRRNQWTKWDVIKFYSRHFAILLKTRVYHLKPVSLFIHLSQKVSECLIQPWQSRTVTVEHASVRRGVSLSSLSSGFLRMLLLIFDQHSSIGLRKGEYGGINKGLYPLLFIASTTKREWWILRLSMTIKSPFLLCLSRTSMTFSTNRTMC